MSKKQILFTTTLVVTILLGCNLLSVEPQEDRFPTVPTGLATSSPIQEIEDSAQTAPTRQIEASKRSLFPTERVACEYEELTLEVECGVLTIPEDHNDPGSANIQLAYTIINSPGGAVYPDPVVYLEGGPGGGATFDVESWLGQPFLEQRDLILVDQRGTGASQPSLNCPEFEGEAYDNDEEAALACRERLIAEGIDLSRYNSAQSAADIDALREALGYKQWNLLGVSYGTRLALTVMRDYPQGVRSAILDSVYPPQVNAYEEQAVNGARAIHELFETCTRDPDCDNAYPDLEKVFFELVDALEEDPVEVVIEDAETGEVIGIYLDGVELVSYIFDSLYDAETFPGVPYVIYELYFGNYEALGEIASIDGEYTHPRQDQDDLTDSEGLYYSVECGEEIPFNNPDSAQATAEDFPTPLAEYLLVDAESLFSICEFWGAGQPRGVENQPVVSPIPVLILTGKYDPITPPSWGEATGGYLDNSFFHVFPSLSHSVIDSGACAQNILADFLESPEQDPDTSCIQEMREVEFWMP